MKKNEIYLGLVLTVVLSCLVLYSCTNESMEIKEEEKAVRSDVETKCLIGSFFYYGNYFK